MFPIQVQRGSGDPTRLAKAGGTMTGDITFSSSRLHFTYGTATASANNFTPPTNGNMFHVTGTTQMNLVDATGFQVGDVIGMIFDGSLTFKNNQTASGANKPVLMPGGIDFSFTADDIFFIMADGGAASTQGSAITRWLTITRLAL